MKLGLIFAGQGSQYVGMGKSLYDNYPEAREVIDDISLDFDFKEMMFSGNEEELSQTANTQPCMVAVAVMATRLLNDRGIVPDYTCGLSLGEYSALSCAGVLTPKEAVELVRVRGKAMEKAVEGLKSKMVAIIGLDRDK